MRVVVPGVEEQRVEELPRLDVLARPQPLAHERDARDRLVDVTMSCRGSFRSARIAVMIFVSDAMFRRSCGCSGQRTRPVSASTRIAAGAPERGVNVCREQRRPVEQARRPAAAVDVCDRPAWSATCRPLPARGVTVRWLRRLPVARTRCPPDRGEHDERDQREPPERGSGVCGAAGATGVRTSSGTSRMSALSGGPPRARSYNGRRAHDGRDPRGLSRVLRGEGPSALPVGVAHAARRRPLDAAHDARACSRRCRTSSAASRRRRR